MHPAVVLGGSGLQPEVLCQVAHREAMLVLLTASSQPKGPIAMPRSCRNLSEKTGRSARVEAPLRRMTTTRIRRTVLGPRLAAKGGT